MMGVLSLEVRAALAPALPSLAASTVRVAWFSEVWFYRGS